MVAEEMFFFAGPQNGQGRQLLGFYHPAQNIQTSAAIVYCHPFAEEKNQSHSIVVKTARTLAQNGFAVLRFDFSGCGDSEGDLNEASLQNWLAEIGSAIELLKAKSQATQIGLWGLRLGANLAAYYAAMHSEITFLLLWQPLPDIKLFLQQFLRQKLSTGITSGGNSGVTVKSLMQQLESGESFEVMGYPFSPDLYHSFLDFAEKKITLNIPTLIISIGEAITPPLQKWAQNIGPSEKIQSEALALEPFWDRYWRWDAPTLNNASLAGLKKIL